MAFFVSLLYSPPLKRTINISLSAHYWFLSARIGSFQQPCLLNLHAPRHFHRLGHRNARRGNRVKGAGGQRPAGGGVHIPLTFPPPWVILPGRCKGRIP